MRRNKPEYPMTGSPEHISLLELQTIIRERLSDAFPLSYWVSAEIGELKVNHSGHCYLELVEKGGDNHVPKAKCNGVIWRSTYNMISSYFRESTGAFLDAGAKVLLRVSVAYHEMYGMSLQVNDIDPTYTLGDMERQRLAAIRKLQEEGVYEMNRELPLPPVIQRIAVISSRNAAGLQDFVKELGRGAYRFEATLFDAVMQGHGAEDSIVDALDRIAARTDDFDVAVIVRGGGSRSDLSCFDSYRLCAHVAQFPIPVVTGIGHDKDQSVADLVAAVSLKTPTAVAGWLVEGIAGLDNYISALHDDMGQMAAGIIDAGHRVMQKHAFTLSQTAVQLTRGMELRLEKLLAGVLHRQQDLTARIGGRLDILMDRIGQRSHGAIADRHHRMAMLERLVRSRQPERILSLGFAIVRKEGSAIRDGGELRTGDSVQITLSKGQADATIVKARSNAKLV